jgi:hypothetical protein
VEAEDGENVLLPRLPVPPPLPPRHLLPQLPLPLPLLLLLRHRRQHRMLLLQAEAAHGDLVESGRLDEEAELLAAVRTAALPAVPTRRQRGVRRQREVRVVRGGRAVISVDVT